MTRVRVWRKAALIALGLGLASGLGFLDRGPFQLVAQALPTAPTTLPTEAPAGTALLIRGPDKALGLPFFSPNAIPVLRGSYLLGADELRIWFTREALVFDSAWMADASWETRAGGRALTMRTADGRLDLALRYANWSLIIESPSADAPLRRFVAAFIDRFTFFLDNAHGDAELSFPATVAY